MSLHNMFKKSHPKLHAKLARLYEEDAQPGQASTSTGSLGSYATYDRSGNMSKKRDDEEGTEYFSEDDQTESVESEDDEAIWDATVAERLGSILSDLLDSEDPDSVDIDALLDSVPDLFDRPEYEMGDADTDYDPENDYDDDFESGEDEDDEDTFEEHKASDIEFLAALEDRKELMKLEPTKAYTRNQRRKLAVLEEDKDLSAQIDKDAGLGKTEPSTGELIARKRKQAKMMRRRSSRMKTARKRKRFRTDYKTLKSRVHKAAIKMVKDKLSGGKRKYNSLSFAQKVAVDKKLRRATAKVETTARKLMTSYRQKLAKRRRGGN